MKKLLPCAIVITAAAALYAEVIIDITNQSPGELYVQNDPKNKKKIKTTEELAEEIDQLNRKIENLNKRIEESEKKIDLISGLKISGYFDVNMSNYKNKPNIFDLGDFELDIVHSYEHLEVAAALVFNQGAELRVGFIDYHFIGGSISPRGRLFSEKGIHLQVGKFDIPFGNDWQHYTPANRISITPPLTTDDIMEGGYNDVGVRFLANFVSFYGTLYILRGIEEGYSYGGNTYGCLLYTSPSPRDVEESRMPSSA